MFTEPEKRDNGLIQNMMIKFDAAASHLEKLLHNRKFICGDEYERNSIEFLKFRPVYIYTYTPLIGFLIPD